MERLLDLAAWLTINNVNSSNIPELRELLHEIHNRLLGNFNEVPILIFRADAARIHAS